MPSPPSGTLGGRVQEHDRRKGFVVFIEAGQLEPKALHRVGAQRFPRFRVVHGLVPEKDDRFFTGADRLTVGRIWQVHGVQTPRKDQAGEEETADRNRVHHVKDKSPLPPFTKGGTVFYVPLSQGDTRKIILFDCS